MRTAGPAPQDTAAGQPPAKSFVRQVRSQLAALTAAERKLADLLLDFPGELASYNASELAVLAGVSNATVTRLIRRLGYRSYDDARRHAREERLSGSPLYQAATGPALAAADTLAAHLQQAQHNLAHSFAHLEPAAVTAMVQALLDAPQVLIFGSRASHAFASYLRWQIRQVRPRVLALPGPGETLAEYLADLDPQDCVVVFNLRRQTAQRDALLQAAARVGARVLLISDQTSPEFDATWSVQCHCTGPGPLDNHVAVMAVCDLLATLVIAAAGPAARRRLAAIEVLHDEMDEL